MTSNSTDENDEFLDQLLEKIKNDYKDSWTEENWEAEMEQHPFFMSKVPKDTEELSPAVEALRQLKWDPDETPTEKAIKLKEEGNLYFKVKNYKKAIISYSLALKEEIEEKHLTSILYSNRAASHFYLKNYRSCLNDCIFSRKFNSKNYKAILKGAECLFELKMFKESIKWCDEAIIIQPEDSKVLELRKKSEIEQKIFERNKRKNDKLNLKIMDNYTKIMSLIKKRNIKFQEEEEEFFNILENPINYHKANIKLSSDELFLSWPVVFLYPEFGQTDFISSFEENTQFDNHIKIMFKDSPDWDVKKIYNDQSIEIYYENRNKSKLMKVSKSFSLLKALQLEGYIVQQGTPTFLIMIKDSDFEKNYLEKYSQLNI